MRYLTLAEALTIAEAVTGIDAGVLARASRQGTARLGPPCAAGGLPRLPAGAGVAPALGDQEFYLEFVDKAAVLAVRR